MTNVLIGVHGAGLMFIMFAADEVGVCMYVCIYVCMYVCMYGNILCYVPAEVYSYEYCMYERSIPKYVICTIVCMYVCTMYVCIYTDDLSCSS